jgi:predicted metal-dependent peptidase
VNAALLAVFTAEAWAMLALNGLTAYVMAADAAVGLVVEPGEAFPTALPGGGGTDFRPALEACEALTEVAAVVYLTDGEGAYPDGCSKPVIWAMSTAKQAPFGITINRNGD